tara:strand:+ start:146 stop:280 length:135 start_codon:yes stop_codon:yes gene_type:complete
MEVMEQTELKVILGQQDHKAPLELKVIPGQQVLQVLQEQQVQEA